MFHSEGAYCPPHCALFPTRTIPLSTLTAPAPCLYRRPSRQAFIGRTNLQCTRMRAEKSVLQPSESDTSDTVLMVNEGR